MLFNHIHVIEHSIEKANVETQRAFGLVPGGWYAQRGLAERCTIHLFPLAVPELCPLLDSK